MNLRPAAASLDCDGVRSTLAETMTTVHDVLRMIRETSVTNHERGSRFEKLMRSYLGIDPTWAEQFSRVWLWADWPGAAANKQDTGIDLVAQDRETGGFCAIQCKFYEPDHTVSKAVLHRFGEGRLHPPDDHLHDGEVGAARRGGAGGPADPRHPGGPGGHRRQPDRLARPRPR